MRKLCLVIALLFFAGCARLEHRPDKPSTEPRLSPTAARNEYRAAQKSFQDKLAAAPGLTLAELQAQWGQVRKGITHKNSTIYHWTQTFTVTPPPGGASELGLESLQTTSAHPPESLIMSCMAIFIVQDNVVVEASSEGRCLDNSLMPSWQPVIKTAGGQGRT